MLPASLRAVLAATLFAALVVPARATTTCEARSDCWTSTNVFSQWTGNPTILCQQGDPVVRIESTSVCELFAGPAVFLRCGSSAATCVYVGGGANTLNRIVAMAKPRRPRSLQLPTSSERSMRGWAERAPFS